MRLHRIRFTFLRVVELCQERFPGMPRAVPPAPSPFPGGVWKASSYASCFCGFRFIRIEVAGARVLRHLGPRRDGGTIDRRCGMTAAPRRDHHWPSGAGRTDDATASVMRGLVGHLRPRDCGPKFGRIQNKRGNLRAGRTGHGQGGERGAGGKRTENASYIPKYVRGKPTRGKIGTYRLALPDVGLVLVLCLARLLLCCCCCRCTDIGCFATVLAAANLWYGLNAWPPCFRRAKIGLPTPATKAEVAYK